MKKKIWIPVIAVVALLAILFIPLPLGSYDDGGTREYVSLTYKIVSWKRMTSDGIYEKTRVYFGKERSLSIDELWEGETIFVENKFRGTVLELHDTSVLVEPLQSEWERSSSDKISFHIQGLANIDAEVGSVVEVCYIGGIMESYPAQISATAWSLSSAKRDFDFSVEWIDPDTVSAQKTLVYTDVYITEIYTNCFFGYTAYPWPDSSKIIKFNGQLSDEWCVGDRISCTYENYRSDPKRDRREADAVEVKASNWDPNSFTAAKPVIYLYPEQETKVSVRLELDGELTCTYPSYGDGWYVTASPDGTLTDEKGQTYQYLYWEGDSGAPLDLSRGFCIKGEDTAAFLEVALEALGLTRREANEFIVYWLPLMQENPYNIISFQTDRYTDAARLEVTPTPDTVIRVFMAWQASEEYVSLPEQELTAPEREGFTVVEWGGAEVSS